MMLTNLAEVLRSAGLSVVEVAGWRTRGHGEMSAVRGVLWHHTATPAKASGDFPSLGIVRDGRSDLRGPLCNLGLGRNGTWYVVAAGLAYHAGSGSYPGVGTNGNSTLIGVEAEHPGTAGNPWPAAQRDSYRRGTAALLKAFGLGADRCIGHKEWAPSRKVDPYGLDMATERRFVAGYMNSEDEDLKPEERQWLLDIHRFLYEVGFIQNKIDPTNKTTGANMIPDVAKWVNEGLGHSVAARAAAEKAANELTAKRPSAVPNSKVELTAGEYVVQSDKNDFENAQRLARVEKQLSEILTVLKAKG